MTLSDHRSLAVLALALALVAGAGVGGASSLGGSAPTDGAAQTTALDSCTTIDEPGQYVLTSNIENGGETRISGTCFEITADNVTLDGNGHVIDGRGVSHTKGVAVVDARNVEVRNFAVNDWHEGVLVENGSATIHDVNSSRNAYGIRLKSAGGSAVQNNTVEGNLVGIYVDSENVTLDANDLSGNQIDVKRPDGPSLRGPPASVRAPAPDAPAARA